METLLEHTQVVASWGSPSPLLRSGNMLVFSDWLGSHRTLLSGPMPEALITRAIKVPIRRGQLPRRKALLKKIQWWVQQFKATTSG